MILELENIQGGYQADNPILHGIDLTIRQGEAIGIIGLNGSGKSTLGKSLMNMLPYRSGNLRLKGKDIIGLSTHNLSEKGMAFFMQGGAVFDELSVWENLLLAANNKSSEIALVKKYFLFLSADKQQLSRMRADRLSGGERYQLALAMCLLKKPDLLILDEPSAGLSPTAVASLFETLTLLRKEHHLTILLIEQNITVANEFCDRICLLERGRIKNEFTQKNIKDIEHALFNI